MSAAFLLGIGVLGLLSGVMIGCIGIGGGVLLAAPGHLLGGPVHAPRPAAHEPFARRCPAPPVLRAGAPACSPPCWSS